MTQPVDPKKLRQMQAEAIQKLISAQAWTLAADPSLFEEFSATVTEVLTVGRSITASPPPSTSKRRVATEDEVRIYGEGLTARQWTNCRCELGHKVGLRFPQYHEFPMYYGKSFQGVMRGYEANQPPITEDEVRTHGEGLTARQWDEKRLGFAKASGRFFPKSTSFKSIYGKSFSELFGLARPPLPMASARLVRELGKNLKTSEWEAIRPTLEAKYKKRFPSVESFSRRYGTTYQGFMTGLRKGGPLATEEEVRKYAKGLTQIEWNAKCRALSKRFGKVFTYTCNFPRRYGKTFGQVVGRTA